jgi:hypothetical protein
MDARDWRNVKKLKLKTIIALYRISGGEEKVEK